MQIKTFLHFVDAAKWTDRELAILKDVYLQARNLDIPHNLIYRKLVEHLPHPYSGIKQKLEALYQQDESLAEYKYETWSREKIVDEIRKLYMSGAPVARKQLPPKLEYQISNHSLPKAITRGFEVFFDSFDHAVAEALLSVGYGRDESQALDKSKRLDNLVDAYHYYRHNEKINNPWTKDEIVMLFKRAHAAGLPLTKSFFTSHSEVYKPLLGISRNLDALRKSIERMGYTWGELVIEAVPDYASWYNENGKSKSSMGELRVKRFLDLNNIPYKSTTRSDRIPVTEPDVLEAGYKHFLPDLLLLDEKGNTIAIVEVYGAIADSGAGQGKLSQRYQEKIEAKERVYKNLPIPYIAIHDNSIFGSDLSNESLQAKFQAFIPQSTVSTIDKVATLSR